MRLLEILFYLLKINSKTTIKNLAEMFNVCEKTIQRDLDKLSLLGIPIISYRGVNGGVEIDKNYIIAKYILTDNDYKDLILSLYISQHIKPDLKKTDLIEKFRLVDSDRCNKILEKLKEIFIIDLDEDQSIDKKDIYKVIEDAIDDKSFVKLQLENTIMEVFPISYVLKKEGLYLYCYDEEYKLVLMNMVFD
ncbi:HTH domain-containing protein, partial [Romboutsia sp. 1001216sp1]|uniref:helix-turn-helix transcriptional regulator n=2 Tax=Romboutsia TaxID=1501226 RepID=UPI00232AE49E